MRDVQLLVAECFIELFVILLTFLFILLLYNISWGSLKWWTKKERNRKLKIALKGKNQKCH